MKEIILAVSVVVIILFLAGTTVVIAGEIRYRADVCCNFQFDRTVEIIFNPAVGTQQARVFYGPPKMSSTPDSPPGGELVEMEKAGDQKWIFKRDCATRSTTIAKDDRGRLMIGYFHRGNFAEGELKPVQ